MTASEHPRSRSLLWLAAMVIATFCLVGLPLLWYSRAGQSDLEAAIVETDEADPGWRWEDIQSKRAVIADEENGALEAIAIAKAIAAKTLQDERIYPLTDCEHRRQLTWALEQALTDVMKSNEATCLQARQLKRFRKGRLPADYTERIFDTKLPVQPLREVAALLELDVHFQLNRRAWAQAVDAVESLLSLQAFLGDEPMTMASMVRFAIRAIAADALQRLLGQAELDDQTLARLQERCEEISKEEFLQEALRGERVVWFRSLEAICSGRDPQGTRELQSLGKGVTVEPRDVAEYLRTLNRVLAAIRLPDEKVLDEVMYAQKLSKRATADLFSGGSYKIVQSYIRDKARLRATQVALAAERYRLAQNRWPRSQDELMAKRILAQIVTDPYDGQPIRIRFRPGGLAVYSIFEDKKDGGGDFVRFELVDNLDLGVHLWNPLERRAPPPWPPEEDEPEGAGLPDPR